MATRSSTTNGNRAHRLRWTLCLVAFCAVTGLPSASLAQAPGVKAEHPSGPVASTFDGAVTVRADRTWQTVTTQRTTIFAEALLDRVGRQNFYYIDQMQALEIVAAYTQKADGRKVPVDPATFVRRDATSGTEAMYRDLKQVTIIFPDLAVGDSVVYTVKTEHKSSAYAGQVYDTIQFPQNLSFADSTLRVTFPKSVPLRINSFGPGFDGQRSETRDAIQYAITIRAQTSGPDRIVALTTFTDVAAVGRTYWSEAGPKAVPTAEVKKLADEITRGIDDRGAQAAAISTWVKRNIRYVAVYLGTGRIVPNDTATILRNRYGDCKDHVTLMAALLAAKGIASEQVLVNAGNVYEINDMTAPRVFNHVMIYLPEFQLYDDPTAPRAAFGVLGIDTYDKPVVHASAEGVRVVRTPAMKPDDYIVVNSTKIRIAADGTMTGETAQMTKGASSIVARNIAGYIQSDGPEVAAQKALRNSGNPGKGRFEMPSPSDLKEPYALKGTFTLDARLSVQSGPQSIPQGMAVLKRPGEFLFGEEKERGGAFRCFAGRQIEVIELTFADGLPMPGGFNARKLETRVFTYTTSYKVENRTLTIRREFVSTVAGQVCKPEIAAEVAEPLKMIAANIANTKLVFGKPQAEAPATNKNAQRAENASAGARDTLRAN
jgi:transglutaminase-like putative cysteine protease